MLSLQQLSAKTGHYHIKILFITQAQKYRSKVGTVCLASGLLGCAQDQGTLALIPSKYQEILDCKLVRKQDCNPGMLPKKMIISNMIIVTDFKT